MDSPDSATETKISAVLVDDHSFFRSGLRDMLAERGVRVVGEAARGDQAIELVERLLPDVVLMDLSMPGMSGIEATRRLAARAPSVQVLALTVSAHDGDVIDALMAGACGYLLKDGPIEELMAALRAAVRGESTLSPPAATRLLSHVRSGAAAGEPPRRGHDELTERELEVLRLLAAGKNNSEIGRELFISPTTVKNHIASILTKLALDNRIQAAVYAVRSGIV